MISVNLVIHIYISYDNQAMHILEGMPKLFKLDVSAWIEDLEPLGYGLRSVNGLFEVTEAHERGERLLKRWIRRASLAQLVSFLTPSFFSLIHYFVIFFNYSCPNFPPSFH